MAKKKIKEDPIRGLGTEDKLIVQKSLPLFALWRSGLTLSEFKILDTYLSRIDSHKPERRTVIFEKGELEKILGVKRINRADLEARLAHLLGHVVRLEDGSKKGFRLITLFEEARSEQDDMGLWQVKLECTQKAMMYFFNIEQLGYLRYKLRSITSITSRYTYVMFTYLEHNRYRKTWEISVDELRHMLDCDQEETYKAYKRFNDLILKKVHREMHEKTECRYSYEPIKKGRSVVAIKFTVDPLRHVEGIDQLTPIEEILQAQESREEERNLWYEAIEEMQLSDAQYEELRAALSCVPRDRLPSMGAGIEVDRFHYIEQIYLDMKARDEEKSIKNKFRYILKIVKNDGQGLEERRN